MARSSIAGKVQTALGAVEPLDLGPTTTHEHLFIDFRAMYQPPAEATAQHRAHEPITLHNHGWFPTTRIPVS